MADVGLDAVGVWDVSSREDAIVGLENLGCCGRRGCNDEELGAKLEGDEWAVGSGHSG